MLFDSGGWAHNRYSASRTHHRSSTHRIFDGVDRRSEACRTACASFSRSSGSVCRRSCLFGMAQLVPKIDEHMTCWGVLISWCRETNRNGAWSMDPASTGCRDGAVSCVITFCKLSRDIFCYLSMIYFPHNPAKMLQIVFGKVG